MTTYSNPKFCKASFILLACSGVASGMLISLTPTGDTFRFVLSVRLAGESEYCSIEKRLSAIGEPADVPDNYFKIKTIWKFSRHKSDQNNTTKCFDDQFVEFISL